MSIQIKTPYSIRLGVVGSGTMGSGIALTALLINMPVTLFDIDPQMLERAREYLENHLIRKEKAIALKNLNLTTNLEDLRGAGVVIEAAPEDLDIKRDLFSRLDTICSPPTILATNTSTLPVTAIAAATEAPERVAGMHFFNPAPLMPLVEIVRAARTSQPTIQSLVQLAELLGKTPVVAGDTPGFIVNRVARPFYGEALRLLGEGAASQVDIDRLVRASGGFRMGPFQLMDLIGIDINFAATQSMYEQTFGEARYRPHQIQAQMVQQNALGRKTGRGFYTYDQEISFEDSPTQKAARTGDQVWLFPGSWASGLREICRQVGYQVVEMYHYEIDFLQRRESSTQAKLAIAILPAGRAEGLEKQVRYIEQSLPVDVPLLCQCCDVTLTEIATWLKRPERLVGFDGLFFANGPIATLVASPTLTRRARSTVERFVASLGKSAIWVRDSPGLVLPRLVCMLANEAAFAVGDGVAEMGTIDTAMQLGTHYPKGPLAWAKELGYEKVVAVLDHLHSEYGEERYRAAPLLRRWMRLEWISA